MDNSILIEIERKLAVLPGLEQRMLKLHDRINEAEDEVKSLLHKFESETLDVERIQKDSLSNTILKLIGKYEGRLNTETQEMLSAKIEYDKAIERVKELRIEQNKLSSNLSELYKEKQTFEDELKSREEIIKNNVTDEAYKTYMELQKEQEFFTTQLIETEEAQKAASRVMDTANSAMQHLKSSENWATFDIWGGGGILSHLAKYDHIDDAKMEFNRLNSQIKDFQKELIDVNIDTSFVSIGIDSTTRAIDFWFDNIFTDMNVRYKIRDDMENIIFLCDEVNIANQKLEYKKAELNNKLSEAYSKKNDLLMSYGV